MTRVNFVNMDIGQIINIVIGGLIVGLIWRFWDRINLYIPSISLNTGLKISGQWKTTFEEDGKTFHEIVTIKQWGKNINGEIVLKEPGEEDTKYKISGTFQNRILVGTYKSNDPTDYEQGAFVLELQGKIFTGKYLFFPKKKGEPIISSPYNWENIKE